jgi:uncharacterized protein YdhG (YjbR/CyaY superfamily)
VDEYVASQPDGSRRALELVRAAIRKALPHAEETISYGMPTYKQDGAAVLYFAGWKRHYSLYPASAAVRAAFQNELKAYEVNDKGTIRFALSAEVPAGLITGIAKARAKEVALAAAANRND